MNIFEKQELSSIYATLNPINICSTQIRLFYINAWEEIPKCRAIKDLKNKLKKIIVII